MKRVEFSYRIEVEVEFTGRDLAVLHHCANVHYDSVCKRAFQLGGFGWGWMNVFLHMGPDDESVVSFDLDTIEQGFAERTVQVRASYRELDTCAKILEQAQILRLPEASGSEENIKTAAVLCMALPKLLHAINDESARLNKST
jgi:hypothetical protein